MMRFFCMVAGVFLLASTQTPALPVEVSVSRSELEGRSVVIVSASGTVRAALPDAWKTLTTYERLPEIVPDMLSSKVISREGNTVMVDQQGEARLLFFSKNVHVILRVEERPLQEILSQLVSGDMAYFSSRWQLGALPDQTGTRITYQSKMAPDFYMPSWLSATLIQRSVQQMLNALFLHMDTIAKSR